MRTRPLGATGIQVSAIGFGTWPIGGDAYGPTDDEESMAALADACERGCSFFDTSNLYGWGHAELLLGQALSGCRRQVVLATKAGYVDPDGTQDFSADAICRSLEGSLRRLRTDYVDLLYLHNPSPTALEGNDGLFRTLDGMRRDGTIRAIGISAASPDEALLFAERHRPDCLQVNFNLGDLRALQNGLFRTCLARRIGIVARTPLAAGFLTGHLGASDASGPLDHRRRFGADARRRWIDTVRRLRPLFEDGSGATPAQDAIRFCLSFEAVSAVVPGMMRVPEVREDLGAAALPQLDGRRLRAVEAVYDEMCCQEAM